MSEMTMEREAKILESAVKTFGAMADVSIMLNQLALIFGDANEDEVAKLERLERRLEAHVVEKVGYVLSE